MKPLHLARVGLPFLALAGMWLSADVEPASASARNQVTLDNSGLGPVKIGATQRVAVARLSHLFGAPTGHSASVCVGGYKDVIWNDLDVQFKKGRFSGYRYWITRANETMKPHLATAKGITLGSTFSTLKQLYGPLKQTGTDFWSSGGLTFGINSATYPSPPSAAIYEIKVSVCPAAL